MFWRIPTTPIGKVLGQSAFKKGDMVRHWDELGNWRYYEYVGCDDSDGWLVGISQNYPSNGILTYIETTMTDFQINDDASIPNPYLNLEIVENGKQSHLMSSLHPNNQYDFPWKFQWSDSQNAMAKTIGFELPPTMTRAEAWDFLQTIPKHHKYKKYTILLQAIRCCVKGAYSGIDKEILSLADYVLLPKQVIDSNSVLNYNWEALTTLTGIEIKREYDNLFHLCSLPLLWRKENTTIVDSMGKIIFTIDYKPRQYARLHIK